MTTSHKPVQIFVCRVYIALLATYIRCEWPTGAEITFDLTTQASVGNFLFLLDSKMLKV